jgi:hypothetical protein
MDVADAGVPFKRHNSGRKGKKENSPTTSLSASPTTIKWCPTHQKEERKKSNHIIECKERKESNHISECISY